MRYLGEIVIGLDRADREQFQYARKFFSRLPQRHRILWNDGPRLKQLSDELAERSLSPTEPGKGRNVWFCVGYTLASRRTSCVALHDCDIVTYERGMLARLLYPVANPYFHYDFCKGYYARVADGKLNGRVGRLLVFPLLKSLQNVYGNSDYLEYMRSYRYPLSGEFAMRTHILNNLRIPSDWGWKSACCRRSTAARRPAVSARSISPTTTIINTSRYRKTTPVPACNGWPSISPRRCTASWLFRA